MATYQISGTTGLTDVGVNIQCINLTLGGRVMGAGLAGGTYSFSGLADQCTYRLIADTRGVTGALAGYTYKPVDVAINGANVSGVGLTPKAPNASNYS